MGGEQMGKMWISGSLVRDLTASEKFLPQLAGGKREPLSSSKGQ